jgi:hypothetical protein
MAKFIKKLKRYLVGGMREKQIEVIEVAEFGKIR